MPASQRVAIYVRVSTTDQDTGLQRDELLAYAKARGWTVHGVYEDRLSGTSDQRPMLLKLMADARARRFDVVAVWKLDRWARSLKQVVVSMQELQDLSVQFVSLRDQIDLTTAPGRLMLHLVSAFAEFEADLIRERVRAGVANARARGKRIGRPPLDKTDDAAKLRALGLSYRAIGARLGISRTSVGRMLAASQNPCTS